MHYKFKINTTETIALIEIKPFQLMLILSLMASFILACQEPIENNEDTKIRYEKNQHKHHHSNEDPYSSANTHMHSSSVEDLIERFESPERDAYQRPEKLMNYLGDIEGKYIMDIGAGSGYFSVKLAAAGAHVIAADVDETFQEYLQQRIKKEAIQNIELRQIPYDSPALYQNEVDMVMIVNTYHHIENRIDYFKKVKEGTKTEGELIIVDFFKTELPVGPPVDHKLSLDVVIAELKSAGYTNLDVNVTLLPYQYIVRAN